MKLNLVFCVLFAGIILKSGSCAPGKVSSGEVLIITTEIPVTEASSVNDTGSNESWEVKYNDLETSHDGQGALSEGKVVPTAKANKSTKPEIYSFRIQSDIKYRYSRTSVTSRVANKDMTKSHEVTFRVILPETAFISKFLMEIDGKSYEAYVKEKEEAKRVYSQAQSQGQSAGLVEVSTRNSNTFNVNVNIKAQSKVTFNLTYEELLSRRLGKYEQVINISPDQVNSVKDFQIVVNIEESQNITYLRVPSLRNDVEIESDTEGNNKDAIVNQTGNKAKISWSPSVKDQENLSKQGIGGKFAVQYDISRESNSGEILVMEGYFVHFFAPEKLKPLRKHVVFVLDISGSMWGRKMEQLKESQKKILADLNSEDFFNIITFSSDVFLWAPSDVITNQQSSNDWYPASYFDSKRTDNTIKQQPYPVTPENIEKAKKFIDSLVASGGTNIHESLITAINLTSVIKNARDGLLENHLQVETELHEPLPKPDSLTLNNSSAEDVTETTLQINSTEPTIKTVKNKLPPNVESLIIFLTDGEPTVGVTDPDNIQELIQNANKNVTLPIFSLGFGEGVDFPFLRKISLQNYGFARKIYEASDAALQLKGFYNEIASPLLANVLFNYTSSEYNVTDITVSSFSTVFNGTEVAIAGKLVPLAIAQTQSVEVNDDVEQTTEATTNQTEDSTSAIFDDSLNDNSLVLSDKQILTVSISGNGREGAVHFPPPHIFCLPIDFEGIRPQLPPRPTPPPTPEDKFLERLWAYLTIQQLIENDLKGITKSNEIVQEVLPTPSSTAPEQDEEGVSKSRQNVTNVAKPETSKQQAIRLALKYGFVTPFTSLVVVKPNSSDVTNTKPADTPPDISDSMAAPQSMNFAVAQQPLPLSLSTKFGAPMIGNRISSPIQSSSAYGNYGIHKKVRPSSSSYGGVFHTQALSTRRPVFHTTPLVYNPPPKSILSQSIFDAESEEQDDFQYFTTEHLATFTLIDIQWFNSSNPAIRVNETEYSIKNETDIGCTSNEGYECSVSVAATGQCVHLKDCISQEFIADLTIFTASYFCPIQSTSDQGNYVGVCCSASNPVTTSTPDLDP